MLRSNHSVSPFKRTIAGAVVASLLTIPFYATLATARAAVIEAARSAAVPDGLDVQKYQSLYDQSKASSDRLRSESNRLQQILKQAQAALSSRQADLDQVTKDIADSQQEIGYWNTNIPALQGSNQALAQEIQRLQSNLNGNQIIQNDLVTQINQMDSRIGIQVTDVQNRQRATDDLVRQYSDISQRVEIARQEVQNAQNALAAAEAQLRDEQNRMVSIDAQVQQLGREQQVLPGRIAQLSQQVTDMNALVTSLQAQVQQKQAMIAPLRERLNQAKQALGVANQKLADAQRQVAQASQALTQIDSGIASAQSKIATLATQLTTKNAELTQAQATKTKNSDEMATLDSRRADIEAQMTTLQTEVADLGKDIQQCMDDLNAAQKELRNLQALDPRNPRVEELKTKIAALTQKKSDDQQAVSQKTAARALLARERSDGLTRRAALENQNRGLDGRISALPGEIAQTTRDQATAQTTLADLQNKRGTAATALDAAKTEESNSRQFVAAAQADVTQSQASLDRELPALQQLQSQLASATQSRDRLATDLGTAQTRLSDINQSLVQLSRDRARSQQIVQDVASRLPFLRTRVAQSSGEFTRLSGRQSSLYRDLDQSQHDLDQSKQILASLQSGRDQLSTRWTQLDAESKQLTDSITSKQSQVATNNQNIAKGKTRIADLSAWLPGAQASQSAIAAEIPGLTATATNANQNFLVADQQAQAGEQLTASALVQLQARKQAYAAQLAAAQKLGQDQGLGLGSKDGTQAGAVDGKQSGTQKGTSDGTQQGLLAGFENGKKSGDSAGYQAGLAQGQASASDYAAGLAQGQAQGDQDAAAEARRTDFPRGQAQRRSDLLAQPLAQSIRLINGSARALFLGPILSESDGSSGGAPREIMMGFNTASGAPDGQSDNTELAHRTELAPASNTPSIHSAMVRVVLPAVDCSSVSSAVFGLSDFEKACATAFEVSYRGEFDRTFAIAQKSSYDQAYEPARQAAYQSNLTVRVQEGYDAVYPMALARGSAEGAQQANRRGFAEGQKQGFAAAIATYRQSEFARGSAATDQTFAQNSVLTLDSATVSRVGEDGATTGDIVAGDRVILALRVSNFGGVASNAGETLVKWEALTSNVAVESAQVGLVSIPARTRADISGIVSAKVLPEAASGGVARFRVTLIQSDGTLVSRDLSVQIAAKVTAQGVSVKYDDTPKRGRSERMQVEVKNLGPIDANQDMRVVLTSQESTSNLVIDVPQLIVGRLRIGEQKKVADLRYTVKSDSALARTITMVLTVYHGATVAARQEIVLKK